MAYSNNVFLTSLGTGDYLSGSYTLNDKQSPVVNYVQTALGELLFDPKSIDNVEVLVGCTSEAADKHWHSLKKEFSEHNLPAPKRLEIPRGSTEEELWNIFETIMDNVPKSSTLTLDITHSFRSLPMVLTILLQYLRLVKQVETGGVYYGAMESVGTAYELQQLPPEKRIIPVFNLTPFVSLYEWSRAIANFINFGTSAGLSDLVKDNLKPVLTKTEGQDKNACALRQAFAAVEDFTTNVRSCRGTDLIKGNYCSDITGALQNVQGSLLLPLKPVLHEVAELFSTYSDSDVKTPFDSVRWCIDHGMTQQGYTLLVEGIIAIIEESHKELEKTLPDTYKRHEFVRKFMTVADQKEEKEWDEDLQQQREIVYSMLRENDVKLHQLFRNLCNDRNDINHAGFRSDRSKPHKLKDRLENYYSEAVDLLKNMGYLQ